MELSLRRKWGAGARDLRLETLVRLRWLAVAGQMLAVLFVSLVLDFELPLGLCMALIALSAWLNMFLRLRFPASKRIAPAYAAPLLAYDTAQLAGLLYLTGGLENPFAFLFLVPVMVSATALPLRYTVVLSLLVLVLATLLGFFHLPVPWRATGHLALPLVYRAGVWVSLVASLVFMAIYAWRIAEEARKMSQALAATELVLAREQHLSALDGLAAAAAHELGTPLGTIALVTKELLRDADAVKSHGEDLALLKSQVDRCRDILGKLALLGDAPDMVMAHMSLDHLLEEVAAPHRHFDKDMHIVLQGENDSKPPVLARNPGILYGLGNLVENAVDFARTGVTITASWNGKLVSIEIADDGPGFSPDMLERVGEPYVTTRKAGSGGELPEGMGLGLGFFIAKTLLERSGARLLVENRTMPHSGAVVRVNWPREALQPADR